MNPGWTSRKLGEICSIELGKTPARDDLRYWDLGRKTGNVWLSIADLLNAEDGVIHDSKEYISDAGAALCKTVRKGTLLVSFKLTLGRMAVAGDDLFTNEAIAALVLRDDAGITQKYLYYALMFFDWEKATDGDQKIKGRTMNKAKLKEIDVAFPNLSEQHRIATILDEAFEGIVTAKANAERNLQNARELFSTQLENTFGTAAHGWKRVALEAIGTTQTGSTPKSSEPENLGDFLPFVKPGDFNRDGTITLDNDGLSEQGAQKARRVPPNSALMVCIGATIGKAGFTDCEIATNQQVNAWTPVADMPAKFMYYQMTTRDFQRRVRQSSGQATLPIINKTKWSALTVLVPPTLDEQFQVVAGLDALRAESMSLETIFERKLAALDELKKALLHQAFNGLL